MVFDDAIRKDVSMHTKKDHVISLIKDKLEKANEAFMRAQMSFVEAENDVDQQLTEQRNDNTRRRKSSSSRVFEFQPVGSKAVMEDLRLMYDGSRETNDMGKKSLKKGDVVKCVLDKRKVHGTIASVSQKGLVILSKDRRKLKMSWEEVEDEETQMVRVSDEDY